MTYVAIKGPPGAQESRSVRHLPQAKVTAKPAFFLAQEAASEGQGLSGLPQGRIRGLTGASPSIMPEGGEAGLVKLGGQILFERSQGTGSSTLRCATGD